MRKYIMVIALALVLSGCVWDKDKKISIPENNQNMENTNQVNTAASYTLEEVTKHSSNTDCWLAASGKVYDVSSFVDKHPGGEKILEGFDHFNAASMRVRSRASDMGPPMTTSVMIPKRLMKNEEGKERT